VKADVKAQLKTQLRALGKPEDKTNQCLDLLERILNISDASAHANISRNVPVKQGSDAANHLDDIIKHSERLKKALEALETDKELATRFQYKALSAEREAVDQIFQIASDVKKYQAATSPDFKAGHLRPEYKGKNVTTAATIDRLNCLKYALEKYFPEIRPTKNQTPDDKFFKLAAILLEKSDPSRAIDKLLKVLNTPYPDV
jgi:hypothetical protein